MYSASTFDDAYRIILADLLHCPMHVCKPRGLKINENLVYSFRLLDPRARLLSCKSREVNCGMGVGEFLWYWNEDRNLSTMLYYNKRMKDFSDDGMTLNSAYGYRMKRKLTLHGFTQWYVVIETLLQDPDSRRAIIHINEPSDQSTALFVGSKDVPCTLSLQFFIRNNKLDLHVSMRSNDVIWGLTYDLFAFTLFQECMLLCLQGKEKFKDLQLGSYYHTAGSMHLYERHFEMAQKILTEYDETNCKRNPCPSLTSLEMLGDLCSCEEELRTGKIDRIDIEKFSGMERFMAKELNDHRIKRDNERKDR
jgi:thymidylate synthase